MFNIKYALIYLKLKAKGLLGKKTIDLDNDGKIESLREEVAGVFNHFRNMHQKLDEVNSKIDEVISDEDNRIKSEAQEFERLKKLHSQSIAKHMDLISNAHKEKEANEKMKQKLSEFIN